MSSNTTAVLNQLANQGAPLKHRATMLTNLLQGYAQEKEEGGEYGEIVTQVFDRLTVAQVPESLAAKEKFLSDLLGQLEAAPLRPATYIEMSPVQKAMPLHALVALDNGEFGFVVVHHPDEVKALKLGDRVLLDGQAKILITSVLNELKYGPEATLVRRINGRHIEVTSRNDEKSVLLANPELIAEIESGRLKPGSAIIMNQGRSVALLGVPTDAGEFAHYRFLDRGTVPEVFVERDIGAPPKVIAEVALHVREEMSRPELRRKFKLRPCITRLLCGVSGTGKTLAVQAIHRLLYEIMADLTGAKVEELPPRVFRFRSSQALSMWFGESEKQIDRFFDEVENLADKPYRVKGREWTLPVLVIMEEAEGMGRQRGGEQIYDRVMTTTLQRLDPSRSSLANKLVVFLSTTNEPHLVDPAFLRRIGGRVEEFGRLNQDGFNSVLGKHVSGLPMPKGRNWKHMVAEIDDHLFRRDDPGIVAVKCHGYSEPLVKHRRDFLTGALVERAVHEAATHAWQAALRDPEGAHVTTPMILEALDNQVTSVVNQLTENNLDRYTDMPEGIRIASVQRVEREDA